jgi:competence ComEA-like helix-hairpin-helix protein
VNIEGRNPVEMVNINTASAEELSERLVGVASVLARRIVDYRESHGPFALVEDLGDVPGIGPVLLARNAHRLTAKPVPVAADLGTGVRAETGALPDLEIQDLEAQSEQAISPASSLLEEESMGERVTAVTTEGVSPVEGGQAEPVAHPQVAEGRVGVSAVAVSDGDGPREPAQEPKARHRNAEHWWRNVLLVILGGLLGALLTLALIVAWSGTLSFAPQRQVDALNRNLRTMQENSELAWERLDRADATIGELDAQVRSLRTLSRRVDSLEAEAEAAQDDLDQMSNDLRSLRSQVTRRMAELDERMDQTDASLEEFEIELGRVQETVLALDSRVKRFDSFLRSLRDLIDGLDQAKEPAAQGSSSGGQAPTPAATPSMLPRPTPTAAR